MDLKNATVLVTGSSRGLGRALVEALDAAGAGKIYATSRNPADVADLVRDGRISSLELDITDAGQGVHVLIV